MMLRQLPTRAVDGVCAFAGNARLYEISSEMWGRSGERPGACAEIAGGYALSCRLDAAQALRVAVSNGRRLAARSLLHNAMDVDGCRVALTEACRIGDLEFVQAALMDARARFDTDDAWEEPCPLEEVCGSKHPNAPEILRAILLDGRVSPLQRESKFVEYEILFCGGYFTPLQHLLFWGCPAVLTVMLDDPRVWSSVYLRHPDTLHAVLYEKNVPNARLLVDRGVTDFSGPVSESVAEAVFGANDVTLTTKFLDEIALHGTNTDWEPLHTAVFDARSEMVLRAVISHPSVSRKASGPGIWAPVTRVVSFGKRWDWACRVLVEACSLRQREQLVAAAFLDDAPRVLDLLSRRGFPGSHEFKAAIAAAASGRAVGAGQALGLAYLARAGRDRDQRAAFVAKQVSSIVNAASWRPHEDAPQGDGTCSLASYLYELLSATERSALRVRLLANGDLLTEPLLLRKVLSDSLPSHDSARAIDELLSSIARSEDGWARHGAVMQLVRSSLASAGYQLIGATWLCDERSVADALSCLSKSESPVPPVKRALELAICLRDERIARAVLAHATAQIVGEDTVELATQYHMHSLLLALAGERVSSPEARIGALIIAGDSGALLSSEAFLQGAPAWTQQRLLKLAIESARFDVAACILRLATPSEAMTWGELVAPLLLSGQAELVAAIGQLIGPTARLPAVRDHAVRTLAVKMNRRVVLAGLERLRGSNPARDSRLATPELELSAVHIACLTEDPVIVSALLDLDTVKDVAPSNLVPPAHIAVFLHCQDPLPIWSEFLRRQHILLNMAWRGQSVLEHAMAMRAFSSIAAAASLGDQSRFAAADRAALAAWRGDGGVATHLISNIPPEARVAACVLAARAAAAADRVDVLQHLLGDADESVRYAVCIAALTPLHDAAAACAAGVLEWLLAAPWIDARLVDHPRRLVAAACAAQRPRALDLVLRDERFRLDRGVDDAHSPVHEACSHGLAEHLRLLLRRSDADPNCQTADGRTPLHTACVAGSPECVALLLRDVRTAPGRTDDQGLTALHVVCGSKPPAVQAAEVACLLLDDARIQPEARDHRGRTALYHAIEAANVQLAMLLRARGADLMEVGLGTDHALLAAAHSGSAAMAARVLVLAGPAAKTEQLRAALLHASRLGHAEVACELLKDERVQRCLDVATLGELGVVLAALPKSDDQRSATPNPQSDAPHVVVHCLSAIVPEPELCTLAPRLWRVAAIRRAMLRHADEVQQVDTSASGQ